MIIVVRIVRIRRLNWYAKRSDRMKNAKVRHQIANSFFFNTLYLKYLEKVKNHQVFHIYRKYYKNSTTHNSSCRTMKPFLNDLDLIDLRHSRDKSLDFRFFMLKISEKKIWKKYSFFSAHFWHENDIIPDFFFQKWEIGVLNGLQLEADRDPSRIVAYIGHARKAIFTCSYLSA